jgi:hypothetical protein
MNYFTKWHKFAIKADMYLWYGLQIFMLLSILLGNEFGKIAFITIPFQFILHSFVCVIYED